MEVVPIPAGALVRIHGRRGAKSGRSDARQANSSARGCVLPTPRTDPEADALPATTAQSTVHTHMQSAAGRMRI